MAVSEEALAKHNLAQGWVQAPERLPAETRYLLQEETATRSLSRGVIHLDLPLP